MMGCTCLTGSWDTQCLLHGMEAYVVGQQSTEEWLSTCCGAPPHKATPDVGEDNPAGICAKCREHTGFEKEESDAACS